MLSAVPTQALTTWTRLSFEDTKSDTLETFPTHEQFIGASFGVLAESLFTDLNFSRPKPVWIASAEGAERNTWFEDTTARLLFDRGFIIRDADAVDSLAGGTWSVRYRLDRFLLTLPEAARHKLLGRIWLKREFEASVHVNLWDQDNGELVWSGSEELRATDWIPKSQLPQLAASAPPSLSPEPPITTAERLVEPVLIGTAIGALTVLFFAVR